MEWFEPSILNILRCRNTMSPCNYRDSLRWVWHNHPSWYEGRAVECSFVLQELYDGLAFYEVSTRTSQEWWPAWVSISSSASWTCNGLPKVPAHISVVPSRVKSKCMWWKECFLSSRSPPGIGHLLERSLLGRNMNHLGSDVQWNHLGNNLLVKFTLTGVPPKWLQRSKVDSWISPK
jgi:hypothetical protein